MVNILFILGAVILAVAVITAIRHDLAQLEAQAKIVPIAEPEPDPDPVDSFQDDRIVTGQLVPITEHHCRASGGRGKRKDWRKKPKGRRREDWSREESR